MIMAFNYCGGRILEGFFGATMAIMCTCFWIDLLKTDPNWSELTLGMVQPTLDFKTRAAMLGLVGSIIMPHNFYLHSALVLNRDIGDRTHDNIKEMCLMN